MIALYFIEQVLENNMPKICLPGNYRTCSTEFICSNGRMTGLGVRVGKFAGTFTVERQPT